MLEAPWTIEMLGRLCARQDARAVTRFRTYKTGVLLAYLAFHQHRPHPREELMELLWPECEPTLGRNSLSQSLSSLRHQLEPPGASTGSVLIADRATVQLNPQAVTTDVAAFEAGLRAAERGATPAERTARLAAAVESYHGDLLPGFYENWNLHERERLKERYLRALDQLMDAMEQAEDRTRAIEYARRAVAADPLREESHARLIRLLAADGQAAPALRQYNELKRVLEEELGVSPDASLRSLVQNLALRASPQASPPLAPISAPAERSLPTGTVTFLLADAELPESAEALRAVWQRHGGQEVKEANTLRAAVFGRASDALACAIAGQRAFIQKGLSAPVRLALHTGEVGSRKRQSAQISALLGLGQRVLAAAHGGQILCSEGSAVLLRRDMEPGVKLTDLGVYRLRDADSPERLFFVDYPGRPPQDFPPPKAEPGYTGNLPLQFSRFFGREIETAGLERLLSPQNSSVRLVTLTGPGGTGKTRLALETARRLLEPYRNAVWFVPLAALSDPSLVTGAIGDALKLSPSPARSLLDQIGEVLSRQPSLLILDNFEQLLEGDEMAADSVRPFRTLLERVAPLKCLATSRRRLGLAGEQEFPVAPLPIPSARTRKKEKGDSEAGTPQAQEGLRVSPRSPAELLQYESVQLFVDRAQAVRPDFQVTGGNAAAVAALCEQLEGIPLALELAAARSQVMTPAQILSRLTHRLDFLTDRRQQPEARHQTLRAAMDWSFRLLSPELQAFFARLSVFRGGWSLEAGEAICEEPLALDYLAMLRECSLVLSEEEEEGTGEMRFRLLETLREYAAEKLSAEEQDALQRRHAAYFLELAETAEPELVGPEQGAWLSRLEADHENSRAALEGFAQRRESELELRLCAAIYRFWMVRGYNEEGRKRLDDALSRNGETPLTTARMKALNGAGVLALRQSDYEAARVYCQSSWEGAQALSDLNGMARALSNLGNIAWYQDDTATARARYEESLALYRRLGSKRNIAAALVRLGITVEAPEEARKVHEEALTLLREVGDETGVALALTNLGNIYFQLGRLSDALRLHQESLVLCRKLEDTFHMALNLHNLGEIVLAQNEYDMARAYFAECLLIQRETGEKNGIAYALEGLAAVAFRKGQPQRAARLFGAADALREAIGSPLSPTDREKHNPVVEEVRQALSKEAFATATVQGRMMSWEEAVAHALEPMEEVA